MAPSYDVHDRGSGFICLLSYWLHHLSCPCWGEIFRIQRLGSGGLFSDAGVPRFAGLCDAAVGDFDACSGFSAQMGPAQADRALDHPDLVVRVGYRRSGLFNALPMVPTTFSLKDVTCGVFRAAAGKSPRCQILRKTAI